MKTYTKSEFKILLAQAAALAVKQEREGTYQGAGVIANRVMEPDSEVLEHLKSLHEIFGFVNSEPR